MSLSNSTRKNGLEHGKIVDIIYIILLLIKKGITEDDFRTHIKLFSSLCENSDFSIMDDNINHIFNEINLAKTS